MTHICKFCISALFRQFFFFINIAYVSGYYRNVQKGINYEPLFLVRFFRNLLLGEDNLLKNRYMMINAPEDWKMPESELLPDKHPTSTRQVPDKYPTICIPIISTS